MRPLSDARLVELKTIFLLYKEITTYCFIFFFFFFFVFILLVALVVRMMQCTAPAAGSFRGEMSVLDRQRSRLRWQGLQGQEEEEEEAVVVMMQSAGQSFPGDVRVNSTPAYQHFPGGVFPPEAKNDPEVDNCWADFTGTFLSPAVFSGEHGVSLAAESFASISRTASCLPMVWNAAAPVVFPPEKVPPPARKRKAVEKAAAMPTRAMPMEDYKDKKLKGEAQEDQAELAPKQSDQSSMNNNHNSSKNIKAAKKEASVDTSKDNSKASEVQQKPDYIHVRARRGQATDSHSLAERVRREKISERMKYLQDLVPGCNRITGKAGMLDEIINYVQSLQRQVEFLSMKLATVNPRLDFNIDDFFAKEMFPASTDPFPQVSTLPDIITNQAILHYNPPQPVVSCGGLNVATNPPEISVRQTSSAPMPAPDDFLDSCFNGGQASSSTTWDIDLHALYNAELNQGRQSAFASQQFQGNIQVNDIKMEM